MIHYVSNPATMDTVAFLINSVAVQNGMEHTLISCMWAYIATDHRAEGILQGTWQHASVHMLKILRKSITARVQQTEFQMKFSGIIFFLSQYQLCLLAIR